MLIWRRVWAHSRYGEGEGGVRGELEVWEGREGERRGDREEGKVSRKGKVERR